MRLGKRSLSYSLSSLGALALKSSDHRLLQIPALEHLSSDVAATDEFVGDKNLGDRGPVSEVLDGLPHRRVGQHVARLVGDTELIEHVDHGSAKSTHGRIPCALHEDQQLVLGYIRLDLGLGLLRRHHLGRRRGRSCLLRAL